MEISPGVFVGKVSARLKDHLWDLTCVSVKNGRALMVETSNETEQGFDFRVHRHDWEPADHDGVNLIRRKSERATATGLRRGWSQASHLRQARKNSAP